MAEYRLTDEAQRDLKQIKKFTEIRFGTRHARAYLLKIRRTFEQLAHAPEMGVHSAIKVGYPLRRLPCASHIIYYSAPDSGIIVLAVLHHSRLPAGELSTRPV
ncbi:type II toxin-antitoxin system RelE/ParE family toxin [Cronobacter dublinensis]|uniref:type II toxin-antitoxin system RelE/ParE family toxin n=1 Tax=Cronobacter dublinensis TaxID=413497 RepID=UPI0023DD395E|nr:type II toxin-antitoxin system RelE/ParE family toxin [Cronobacter dublinensis]EKF2281008.1 type II toxin-antitoxin system RelE/ParE family toxin [Cronobacter dublinensis]EKF2294247.1 type II toxin-antitoxin system RelE/ParE family toxin [Cronobacter dublinensis]EKF2298352.1 type II toxin-antitoxin system RelE/ParE family toxin [Cronobacter dublinensis]EKK5267011.1 type II toxin-antitoxin system RelE/ParE family toxin [Cronobacter dublinensis]EKM0139217.1 type II toxin-antitoxin system RelE